MAQSALGGKDAEQAYKDFVTELTQVKQETKRDELRDKLEDMKKIAAIKVTPLMDTAQRSHLRKVHKK